MCHLQKFSDDSTIMGCISEDKEEEYRGVVERFTRWCSENHFQLSISKTKEVVVDFQWSRKPSTPITIQGEKKKDDGGPGPLMCTADCSTSLW